MIKNIEHLKNERPDLVELFEGMNKEQLLEQCYQECIDAINMEARVSVFMKMQIMAKKFQIKSGDIQVDRK